MPTDLGLAHLGTAPAVPSPRQVTRATLLNTPVSQASPLFIVFTDGHEAWPHEVIAGHWEPRGLTLPVKGDICVALIDSLGDVWVVGWEGTTNVTAVPIPGAQTTGDLLMGSGATWARVARGTAAQELVVRSDGTVQWTAPPTMHLSAWGAGAGGDDTPIINSIMTAAPAGAIIKGQPGATYSITGLSVTKKLTFDFHGCYVKLANASNKHMLDITASGCRARGGEWDGNRANQTNTGLYGIVADTTSDTIIEECWVHSVSGTCIGSYDSSMTRIVRCRANDASGHTIYANAVTASRSIVHILDCIVDRTAESPTGFGARGIKVDRSNSTVTFNDIKITGIVKMPAVNNSGAICVECWGGCQNVRIDVQTEGGGVGVSADGVDGGQIHLVSKGAIQEGLELATSVKHLSVTGSIDGQGVGNAGVSISNTACEEVTLDLSVDNCISRCIKGQNSTNVTVKGQYRMRVAGQMCMEIIACTDWHYDAILDGRNDAGVATAQDGLNFDHSYNQTGFLKIAHFARSAVGFYSFNVGSKVDNISLWGSITDCGTTPVQNFGFSSAADLGTNVRFHFDTDQFAPNVASAAALTLPWHADVVKVTGTTGITSVTANNTQKGREITLIFTAALTVTSGSNLILNGNFTTAANSVLRLLSDGTNWYEVSRKP